MEDDDDGAESSEKALYGSKEELSGALGPLERDDVDDDDDESLELLNATLGFDFFLFALPSLVELLLEELLNGAGNE